MIPLSIDQPLKYTDADGVTFLLKQPTDELMLAVQNMSVPNPSKSDDPEVQKSQEAYFKWIDAYFNMIIIGWESERADIPKYPTDETAYKLLRCVDKAKLVNFFFNAGNLTTGEVKNS